MSSLVVGWGVLLLLRHYVTTTWLVYILLAALYLTLRLSIDLSMFVEFGCNGDDQQREYKHNYIDAHENID